MAFTPSQLRQPHFELLRGGGGAGRGGRGVNTGPGLCGGNDRSPPRVANPHPYASAAARDANVLVHACARRDVPLTPHPSHPHPPTPPYVGLCQAEVSRARIRFLSHRLPEALHGKAAGRGAGGSTTPPQWARACFNQGPMWTPDKRARPESPSAPLLPGASGAARCLQVQPPQQVPALFALETFHPR